MSDFKHIDQLQTALQQLGVDHSKVAFDKSHEDLILRWTYHSNGIEGNTLSLKETKVVLEGITVAGKSINEHLEAINHRDAILFIEQLASGSQQLNEHDIKSLHHLILKSIDDSNAGKYRNEEVVITGAEHNPPSFLDVPKQMQDLITWYQKSKQHPIEKAAQLHINFVGIHPFVDGNGRTARLLMNLELIRAKLPAVIIKQENKLEYYETLDLAHTTKKYQPFVKLLTNKLTKTLKQTISKEKANQAVKQFDKQRDNHNRIK